MCWNTSVSLNTFLFSGFILLLIIYNNAYTEYKIQELNNIWVYLFLSSFIFMQLVEYFIWKNINNPFYNNLFTIIGFFLIGSQPIFSSMIISNKKIRNIIIFIYLLFAIPYAMYQLYYKKIYSKVSKSGHLSWETFKLEPPLLFIWLFCLVFSLIYEKLWVGLSFGVILFIISYYKYNKEGSVGSMWCWLINSIMIYYAFYLLFYLPYYNKKNIC